MKNIDWICEKFIAHCGLHNEKFPKYSLPAFENAIEHNYIIELDVQPCLDGVAVAHNPTFMSGNEKIRLRNLKECELKNFRLGSSEYYIPSLSEVFELVKGRTPIFIDIKQHKLFVGKFEERLLKLIENYIQKYNAKVAIIAFNPFTIKWFKKHAPDIARGFLTTKWTKHMVGCPKTALGRFVWSRNIFYKSGDADFVDINIRDLPTKQLRKFPNMPVLGWTVRSQAEFDDKARYVDNITFEGFIPKRKNSK